MREEDLWAALVTYHRELFLPDFERILGEATSRIEAGMRENFEELDRRLDRLTRRPGLDGRSATR